jgi:hypothetical protein
MNCPKCGAENSDGAKFCSKCGQSLAVAIPEPVSAPPPVATCPSCKTPKKEGAIFCGSCGQGFEATPAAATKKGSNTAIIVIIIALIAIIGAAGTGWYMWDKSKSAPGASTAASAPQGTPGQPGMPQVDANGMPIPQTGTPGQAGADGQQPATPGQPGAVGQQPGMPQVDANGMPIPQAGTQGQAGADSQQPGVPSQPGAVGQQPMTQGQTAGPQQGASGQQQDVMPEPMPQEARKRRAAGENPSPRRNVRAGGSIDDQYNQRAASECPSGGSGFFCREKLRYQLCNGRWSPTPPPGQTQCQKAN